MVLLLLLTQQKTAVVPLDVLMALDGNVVMNFVVLTLQPLTTRQLITTLMYTDTDTQALEIDKCQKAKIAILS